MLANKELFDRYGLTWDEEDEQGRERAWEGLQKVGAVNQTHRWSFDRIFELGTAWARHRLRKELRTADGFVAFLQRLQSEGLDIRMFEVPRPDDSDEPVPTTYSPKEGSA